MRTPNLAISLSRNNGTEAPVVPSPLSSPRSPHTPNQPSPLLQGFHEHLDPNNPSLSPSLNVPLPPSPKGRSPKSFFSNPIASRSATKLSKQESPSKSVGGGSQGSSLSHFYGMSRAMGSSPELTATYNAETSSLHADDRVPMISNNNLMVPTDPLGSQPHQPKKKASKHKFNILGRKGSVREDEAVQGDGKPAAKPKQNKAEKVKQAKDLRIDLVNKEKARSRNLSADRQGSREESHQMNGPNTSIPLHIKSTGSRAADGLGRAAKGLLGKFSNRTGNGDPRDSMDKLKQTREEEAQKAALTKSYKVVNLPLDQQTRMTRICKRLEDCKDKTEFWLPAVAYRCIDYLNDKGMTHEGIYRVPGSEREIRNWMYRFDTEEDIDLLEEEDLYDVNAISSMFKAWLRDLPDEVFPKTIQHKITSSVPGGFSEQQGAPDILITELSNLPPFNYYLLFAVTAHITMLLNASKENKMSFHNLCVCFMPSMKMEMPCFSWLILDWKNCWKGCNSERDYLNKEYAMLDNENSTVADGSRPVQHYDKYDRYPPPGSRQKDGTDKASLAPSEADSQISSHKISGQTDNNLGNSRDVNRQLGDSTSKSSETSLAAMINRRPVTSDSKHTKATQSEVSTPRREKNRPAVLDSTSPQSTNGSRRRSKSAHDPAVVGFSNLKSDDRKEETSIGGYAPLELSPVKPLSPFGNLD